MLKSHLFSDSILSWFRGGFGEVFGRFFEPKTEANQKKQKFEKPHETLRGRIEFQCRLVKKHEKSIPKSIKIVCFFGPRFWRHFGRVLGGFWEPEILDFRTFFDVFSKQILKRVSEGQKIDQNGPKDADDAHLGSGLRWSPSSWGEKKRGESRTLWPELFSQDLWGQDFADRTREEAQLSSTLRTPSVGGGLKPPGGGAPPPPHF